MAQKYTFFIYLKRFAELKLNAINMKLFFVEHSFLVLYIITTTINFGENKNVINTTNQLLALINRFARNLKKFTFAPD